VNAESPRNIVTTASHGFLTRDGAHPSELLEEAKKQLKKYDTVEYVKGLVADISKDEGGFRVRTDDGRILDTKRLIIATGYKDNLDKCNLKGLEKVYGKSVYPCPFCDGWEHRDQKLALFGGGKFIGEFAKVIGNWSKDVIIFTNGDTSAPKEAKEVFKKGGINFEERKIRQLNSDSNGVLIDIELEDGTKIEREAGFLMDTHEEPATNFAITLGVKTKENDWGMEALDVGESGETNVDGLYIVGDAKAGFNGLISAAKEGAVCSEGIVHARIAERWS